MKLDDDDTLMALPPPVVEEGAADPAKTAVEARDADLEARDASVEARDAYAEDDTLTDGAPVPVPVALPGAEQLAVGASLPVSAPALAPSTPAPSTLAPPVLAPAAEDGLLRGLAKRLVENGLLEERRAISLALRAKESGLSLLRLFSLERTRLDLHGIYAFVGQELQTDIIESRNDIYMRLSTVAWISDDLAEQWEVLPLQSDDPETVAIALVDPYDLTVLDWARRHHRGKRLVAVPIMPEAFLDGLARYRSITIDFDSQSNMFVPIDVSWDASVKQSSEVQNWDVPVVVDYVLHRSHTQGASDVHIEPHGDNVVVRLRIDGTLHEELRLPASMQAAVVSRIKVLAHLDVAERRLPQDGRISIWINNHPLDIRISTLPTVTGEKVVMRLLDETSLRPRLELLGLADQGLALLIDKVNAPYGMVLISGPTGSGKTTTLYSCLSSIDRVGRNVVTIEDPVEYRLQGIQQTQVNEAIGFSFANGLRTVLRQDPDVIMVGECRDRETAQMAIQAALTGHLVLSTIHANDTVGVVSRLIDIGVDPFLVANAISLVIAQRLLRMHCPHCRTTVSGQQVLAGLRAEGVSAAKTERLGIVIEPDLPYVVAAGCARCRHSGYLGRQAVFEIFATSNQVRAAIMADPFDPNRLREQLAGEGLQTMLQAGMAMVEEGATSVSEVIRVLGEG